MDLIRDGEIERSVGSGTTLKILIYESLRP